MLAGTPELVVDINQFSTSIGATSAVAFGDRALFTRFDGLWETDGTSEGTRIVKAIDSDRSTSLTGLTKVGNHFVFTARSSAGQLNLWTTDGSENGTQPLTELKTFDQNGVRMTVVGETAYFQDFSFDATDLWRTDGTLAGTTRLSSRFGTPTEANGTLYFVGSDEANGMELWKGDGTDAGTQLVKNINPDGWSSPSYLTNVNGTLYFVANDGVNGHEIWKTDGTESGTVLVKDVGPDNSNYSPRPYALTESGGRLFFVWNGRLWKSDGTSEGTLPLNPATEMSTGRSLVDVNDTLFFQGSSSPTGTELWKSDGTDSGTVLVKDIDSSNYGSSNPNNLKNVNGTLYFVASDSSGFGVWKSDGTDLGTTMVTGSGVNASFFAAYSRGVLFGFGDLWTTDGTAAGTATIGDGSTVDSEPDGFIRFKGAIYFYANDGSGMGLWKTDGTAAGTQKIKGGFQFIAKDLVQQGDYLIFSASDRIYGSELWRSDGTEEGTVIIRDAVPGPAGSDPQSIQSIRGKTYFLSQDKRWVTDGTDEGTQVFNEFQNTSSIFELNDSLYFFSRTQLWKNDGTPNGNVLVRIIPSGAFIANMTVMEDTLLFTTSNFLDSTIWKSDGTAEGTVKIMDFSWPNNPAISSLSTLHGQIFFLANFGASAQLWRSDGTPDGTQVFKDLGQYQRFQSQVMRAELNGTLYFTSSDETHGDHLWKTDGTEAGTQPLIDPATGEMLRNPTNMQIIDGRLYIQADSKVWMIDGATSSVTHIADNPDSAPKTSFVPFAVLNNQLLFAANGSKLGRELWSVSLGTHPDDLNQDGTVNLEDLNLFCTAIKSGSASPEALEAFWVRNDTGPGDANFDHLFDSADLIAAFQSGKYETGSDANWNEGDWDCDGTFGSNDLIVAFQRGWYSPG